MKVFCTGATGFVGAHTALALLAAGHEPQLLVRDQKAARDWFEARGRRIGRFVTVDIRDQTAFQHTMAGCDAVFHAAATVTLDPRKARQTYDFNVGATKAVLGAARALGTRVTARRTSAGCSSRACRCKSAIRSPSSGQTTPS
jgi:dihydroflavonol-4-reductase